MLAFHTPTAAAIAGAPDVPAWLLAALATPAFIEDGDGVVPMGPRVWAAWASHACRGALAGVLGRPVAIDQGGECGAMVFSAELRSGADPVATIGLDLQGARIIADALGISLAGVRGAGALTAPEAGLVEYAALEVLDRVLTAAFADSPVVLGRVRAGQDAMVEGAGVRGGARIPMRMAVAGRSGGAVVVLHATTDAMPPLGPTTAGAASGAVPVAMALPHFALAREELDSLNVGDVVLPGLASLEAAVECRLVTRTLWRLCGAEIVGDAATHLGLSCGPLEIRPDAAREPTPDGHVPACILVGGTEISFEALRGWTSPRAVSLGKTPGLEATLVANARIAARGELVRADGEVAMRLNTLVPSLEKRA